MKCVRMVNGRVARLSDDDAFQVVERDKDGGYCPKNVWRKSEDRSYLKIAGLNLIQGGPVSSYSEPKRKNEK